MINIKNSKEISAIKEGGKILSDIIDQLKGKIKPGIETESLGMLAENLILKYGKPSFKNYNGFPSSLCVSINDEIVHGIPSKRKIKDGDIVSLDIGLFYKGFHTDMAVTVPVGRIDPEVLRLLTVTKKALKRGIKKTRPGNTIGDIGNTIQRYVESQGFNIIEGLCGHGIGRDLHESPEILNIGKRGDGPEIKKGMVFCIEPMISIGSSKIVQSADGFTFKTEDGSFSAHFEHTIAVTEHGCEILTLN
jgi:methionyl aminopeptidase